MSRSKKLKIEKLETLFEKGREGFYPDSKSFVGASSRPNLIIKNSIKTATDLARVRSAAALRIGLSLREISEGRHPHFKFSKSKGKCQEFE